MSLLLGESGLLSFGVLAFWHNGRSPLVLASEGSVLERDGFKVTIGDIEGKGGSSVVTIDTGEGTGANTTNLEVGVVVEIDEVGMALGELGEGSGSVELCLELVHVVLVKLEEVVGTANG